MIGTYTVNINPRDITVCGYNYAHEEYTPSNFVLEYELELEERGWGIKSVVGMVVSIKGALYSKEVAICNFDEYESTLDVRFDAWGQYCPCEMEIDIEKKEITIT